MIRVAAIGWVIFGAAAFCGSAAASNEIRVDPQRKLGSVNPLVFGNNLLGHGSRWGPANRYSDYGSGLWDPAAGKPVDEAIALAEEAGIRALRFPGGGAANHYDWRKAVGPDRKDFRFGLDEFVSVCKRLGAEPVFTLAYFAGNESDHVELVKYLSARGVRYFEVGNETYWGDKENSVSPAPEAYGQSFVRIYRAVKSAEPQARLGAVLFTADWNSRVIATIGPDVDFGVVHTYPTPVWGERLETMDAREIFRVSLAKPVSEDEPNLRRIAKLFERHSGKKVPVAVTEYNGGFVQDKPVPYRHALGTALLNAELLRIFLKPEHNILMANYWNFINEYWGMAANGFGGKPEDLRKPYFKRPNFYVFEMYRRHFGRTLVHAETDAADLSVTASSSSSGGRVYLMVINKNLERSITTRVQVNGAGGESRGDAWVLNAPSIDSTNEADPDTVSVKRQNFSRTGNAFSFTFEPHSLTALEMNLNETGQ